MNHIFFCETSNDGTLGGSHSCMYNLVRHFDRRRFRFTVGFFSENPYVDRYRDLGVDVAIMPFVPSRRDGPIVVRKAINWYNREYKLEKFLSSYISGKKFDVVLMNNTICESKNFINVCNRLKLPIVVYERGILNYLEEHVLASERIAASIAMSQAILQHMREYKFKSKIMKMIYDGIDPDAFKGPFDTAEIKNRLEIPVDSKVIGIVGNVRYWKGQKYFIEAFRYLAPKYPDLYGLIIGAWSEFDHEYLRTLRQDVKDYGLEDRVRFLGFRKDVPAILSILDVFVHASITPEPFGMVLLEAMAARIPIIATRFGGPIETLDAGRCGALVPPEDGRAIAKECTRYFSDGAYRRDMVEKAYGRLCDHFHVQNTVHNVGELLEIIKGGKTDR